MESRALLESPPNTPNPSDFFGDGDWWRRDGAFRLLHDINPLRLQLTADALRPSGWVGKQILDVGCGGGIFAEAAAREGASVVGCDISAGAIQTAKQHAAASGVSVDYRCGGIDLQERGSYDVVTCFEMLEHVESPAVVVADVATMLRPGGAAVFSTINRTFRAWALMIGGLEHALRILPQGTHQYSQFISPAELSHLCTDCGLSVRRISGMRYSFFGKTYLLYDNPGAVNYFLIAKRT